jgi:putative protease
MNKPELLLPAGNTESFYAALEGGADAVYLGLKHFNARERAFNFSNQQIPVLLDLAHKKKAKVYITLNTVVKNNELPELLNVLDFLNKVKPDAVIIQDWGVYYLIKNHFPNIKVHASTQMANHNSVGAEYSRIKGFERVILARELTMKETETINQKSTIETETFIHGALCYSFSGMCHFSSYINANSANRGLCSQICRRSFNADNEEHYYFSLKDHQQIEHIPELMKAGIRSLKVEGRLKSADYVYTVARAYRMVIDDFNTLPEAMKLLETAKGRDKTTYFIGNDLSDAFTLEDPNTGMYLGIVKAKDKEGFEFESDFNFASHFRLRVLNKSGEAPLNINVNDYVQEGRMIKVKSDVSVNLNAKLFLTKHTEKKFSSRLPANKTELKTLLSLEQKQQILGGLVSVKQKQTGGLFLRIDSVEILKMLNLDYTDHCILAFSRNTLMNFDFDAPFLLKDKTKIWVELPHFIAEDHIDTYKYLCQKVSLKGFNRFFLNHASQKMILPEDAFFSFTENVYAYNDAAAAFLTSEGAVYYSYPFENDGINLDLYRHKKGIVPVYYYPRLFISRMPVKISKDRFFTNENDYKFKKYVIDGISYTIPVIPVSLLHRVNQLKQQGFQNFLVDMRFEKPSSNRLKTLIKKFGNSEQVEPSSTFNYKKELR